MTRVVRQSNELRKLIGDAVPDAVFDAGLGCGRECGLFHEWWPDIPIFGFEPHEGSLERLRESVGGFIEIFPYAVSDKTHQTVEFHKRQGNRYASSMFSRSHKRDATIKVQTRTFDWLDRIRGPFENILLWLDCEGAEVLGLNGASGLLSRNAIKWINVEMRTVAGNRPGSAIHSETHNLLTDAGFVHVKDLARFSKGVGFDSIYYHESVTSHV